MKKDINVISRVLKDANKDKTFVGLTARLKKNGQFRKINGKIHDIRISQDGKGYIIMENFLGQTRKDGRKWQSVSIDNIMSIRSNKINYKR